jgi:hypothetical protein
MQLAIDILKAEIDLNERCLRTDKYCNLPEYHDSNIERTTKITCLEKAITHLQNTMK